MVRKQDGWGNPSVLFFTVPKKPTIQPPLKYHGGKAILASRILPFIPFHHHYVEPYAGGLAILLAKNPSGVSEVVNDLNGELAQFWRVLRDDHLFSIFHRKITACPFSEKLWKQACSISDDFRGRLNRREKLSSDDRVRSAVAFFVRCRQSLAGRMDSFAPLSRSRTRRGMNEQASGWLTAVEGLPEVHSRLKRVVILNRDALDVIRSQDGVGTFQYLDPPYVPDTRTSPSVYVKEAGIEHHQNLLKLITSGLESRIMISGYRSELYDDLLHGWRRVDFDIANHAAGGKVKRRMVESIWMNY